MILFWILVGEVVQSYWKFLWYPVGWGPLILVKGFHPQLIQICSMHVLNLGLAYDLNGCSMSHGQYIDRQQFFVGVVGTVSFKYMVPRSELSSHAWGHFYNSVAILVMVEERCRANKIYCSQPRFRAKMVSWLDSACFFGDPTILPRFTTFYVCTCMPFDVIVCWGLR